MKKKNKREEFIAIVQAMLSTGIYPDFITSECALYVSGLYRYLLHYLTVLKAYLSFSKSSTSVLKT